MTKENLITEIRTILNEDIDNAIHNIQGALLVLVDKTIPTNDVAYEEAERILIRAKERRKTIEKALRELNRL